MVVVLLTEAYEFKINSVIASLNSHRSSRNTILWSARHTEFVEECRKEYAAGYHADSNHSLIVAGGKNSCKSTFLLYLLNSLLSPTDELQEDAY
jgi:polynucleotide 5'-kinase involved in rRNA processing